MNILTKGQRLDSAKAVFFNIFHGRPTRFTVVLWFTVVAPVLMLFLKITKYIYSTMKYSKYRSVFLLLLLDRLKIYSRPLYDTNQSF